MLLLLVPVKLFCLSIMTFAGTLLIHLLDARCVFLHCKRVTIFCRIMPLNRLWYIQSSYNYPISACIWHNAFTRQARRTPISPIFMTMTGSLNPSRILTTRTHSTGIAATVFCLLSVLHSIDSPLPLVSQCNNHMCNTT